MWQFDSNDGAGPEGAVVSDANGDLYSTTNGKINNVFELMPKANDRWKEAVLI